MWALLCSWLPDSLEWTAEWWQVARAVKDLTLGGSLPGAPACQPAPARGPELMQRRALDRKLEIGSSQPGLLGLVSPVTQVPGGPRAPLLVVGWWVGGIGCRAVRGA